MSVIVDDWRLICKITGSVSPNVTTFNVITARRQSDELEHDMTWTPEPPEDSGQAPLPVFRVKPGRPLECVIECRNWVGVLTHYWNKQTIVHSETDCPACDANLQPVWQGFLAVGNHDGSKRLLLQITPQAARCLRCYKIGQRQLMGCKTRFMRLGRRANSPLDATCLGWTVPEDQLTQERLAICVARLLRIRTLPAEAEAI